MDTQLSLFDPAVPTLSTSAPRCNMCARPARYVASRREYATYCGGNQCPNQSRICQSCGAEFRRNVNGAGTKYCSTECKRRGYTIGHGGYSKTVTCAWCGEIKETPHRSVGDGRVWPYICAECLHPLRFVANRLRKHRVPHERARALIDNPGCEVCGANIIEAPVEKRSTHTTAALVVDHDHRCCPRVQSCGKCVRGLLCNQCNAAAGLVGDDPGRAQRLASYLARTRSEVP